MIEIAFILVIQDLVEYNMSFVNNIIIRRVSVFIYDIEFIVFNEVYMNKSMIDFAISIFFATFLRDVNMSSIVENMKMR